MADIKWLKITNTMFEDEKIEYLESLPDGDALINIWVKTLCLASKCNERGYLVFANEIPYTFDLLAIKFKKTVKQIEYAYSLFSKLGMLSYENDIFLVLDFSKYMFDNIKKSDIYYIENNHNFYMVINNISNMKYIGRSVYPIELRFSQHIAKSKSSNIFLTSLPLYTAMNYYGCKNFTVISLCNDTCLDFSKANNIEQSLIKKYNTLYPNGYNVDGLVGKSYEYFCQQRNNYISNNNINNYLYKEKSFIKNFGRSI